MGRRNKTKELTKSEIEEQQDTMSQAVASQETHLSNLDTQTEEAEKNIEDSQNDITTLEDAKKSLAANITTKHAAIDTLVEKEIVLETKAAELTKKIVDLQATHDADVATYKSEIKAASFKLADLKLDLLQTELQAKDATDDLAKAKADLIDREASIKKQIEGLTAQKVSAEAQLRVVVSTKEEREAAIVELETRLHSLEAEIKTKQTKIKELITIEAKLVESIKAEKLRLTDAALDSYKKEKELGDYEAKLLHIAGKEKFLEGRTRKVRAAYKKAGLPIDF